MGAQTAAQLELRGCPLLWVAAGMCLGVSRQEGVTWAALPTHAAREARPGPGRGSAALEARWGPGARGCWPQQAEALLTSDLLVPS